MMTTKQKWANKDGVLITLPAEPKAKAVSEFMGALFSQERSENFRKWTKDDTKTKKTMQPASYVPIKDVPAQQSITTDMSDKKLKKISSKRPIELSAADEKGAPLPKMPRRRRRKILITFSIPHSDNAVATEISQNVTEHSPGTTVFEVGYSPGTTNFPQ